MVSVGKNGLDSLDNKRNERDRGREDDGVPWNIDIPQRSSRSSKNGKLTHLRSVNSVRVGSAVTVQLNAAPGCSGGSALHNTRVSKALIISKSWSEK